MLIGRRFRIWISKEISLEVGRAHYHTWEERIWYGRSILQSIDSQIKVSKCFFLSWLLTTSLIFIGSRAQTLYQIIRMRQYTQYTLVLGVGFNTERCKLGEFKGFSCSGHVTYQIHTWLSKLKAPLTEQTWPKINTEYKIMKTLRRNRTQSNNTTTTITITIIIIIFFVRTETTTGPSISKCLTNSQENTKYKIMKTSRPNRAQSHFWATFLELYSSTYYENALVSRIFVEGQSL